jgi:hypothetical protein
MKKEKVKRKRGRPLTPGDSDNGTFGLYLGSILHNRIKRAVLADGSSVSGAVRNACLYWLRELEAGRWAAGLPEPVTAVKSLEDRKTSKK